MPKMAPLKLSSKLEKDEHLFNKLSERDIPFQAIVHLRRINFYRISLPGHEAFTRPLHSNAAGLTGRVAGAGLLKVSASSAASSSSSSSSPPSTTTSRLTDYHSLITRFHRAAGAAEGTVRGATGRREQPRGRSGRTSRSGRRNW
ncbi:hypothetical protein JCM6882_008312 [Rhodosporidiobolus microsporus]